MHHYQPESNRASMQWKHPSSSSTQQYNAMLSPGKFMLTMFWDSQGVLLAHFQKRGKTVNSELYCEVLLKLQDEKTTRPTGKRGTAPSWQCRTPYSTSNQGQDSRTTVGTSWTFALQLELGPYWLPSGQLKNHHGSKCFTHDKEVEKQVRKLPGQQSVLWVSACW
jgi:hypothetical protein